MTHQEQGNTINDSRRKGKRKVGLGSRVAEPRLTMTNDNPGLKENLLHDFYPPQFSFEPRNYEKTAVHKQKPCLGDLIGRGQGERGKRSSFAE